MPYSQDVDEFLIYSSNREYGKNWKEPSHQPRKLRGTREDGDEPEGVEEGHLERRRAANANILVPSTSIGFMPISPPPA